MDDRWLIRPAEIGDLGSLVQIEGLSFSDPWPVNGFRDILESPGFLVAVVETEGDVVGYVVSRSVGTVAEILDFAVTPARRRQGMGSALLRHTIGALRDQGIREVFLEVRESNASARRLYRGFGFRSVGSRPRYYRKPIENAVLLRLLVDPDACDRSP